MFGISMNSSSNTSSTSSSSSSLMINLATAAIFVAAPIAYYRYYNNNNNNYKNDKSSDYNNNYNNENNNNNNNNTTLHDKNMAMLSNFARSGSHIKPPFPTIIRDMLSKCRMAYLSTVDTEENTSHLSLMRFTYLNDADDGEVVIMSTNTQTKKFEMLQKQHGVALLVHDFGLQQPTSQPTSSNNSSSMDGLYSITLNGNCRIVTDPTKAKFYQDAHLAHNPDYPQFIIGKDIAILCVEVNKARICDIHDRVTKWDVANETNINK